MLINGDTTICFSIPQSKFLLKQIYLVSQKDTLLQITELELKIVKDKVLIFQEQIKIFQNVIENEKQINQNLLVIIKQKDDEIKILTKEISKQKVKTSIAIIGGLFTTSFISYFCLKK
jgi:hypothetical protein